MEIKVGNNTVKFYDSPENLTIRRHQAFNKYLMIDNEVGSSIADYDKRMQKAIRFLNSDLKTEAAKELENNRQNVYNCLTEYVPKGKALAILVKSINGKKFHDIESETLKQIESELNRIGFTHKMMEDAISEVKKKSN